MMRLNYDVAPFPIELHVDFLLVPNDGGLRVELVPMLSKG